MFCDSNAAIFAKFELILDELEVFKEITCC